MGAPIKMTDSTDPHVIASAKREYLVSHSDLPVSCPMPDMILWNAHPRVYLPIEKTGQAECPYCSAIFKLKAD